MLLDGPWAELDAHVRDVLRRGATATGHVVNLGHGVPPTTDPDVLTRIVELVHSVPDLLPDLPPDLPPGPLPHPDGAP